MADLTLDEVRDIGIAAIRRVIGDTFTEVEADIRPDFEGQAAYFFEIQFPTEKDWWHASKLQAQMAGAIIDDLYLKGDEHFPFIRILSNGSWTFAHHAAAE